MCGGIIAQNTPNRILQKAVLSPNSKVINKSTNNNRAAGPFSMWVEPVGDVMTNKGITLTGASQNQDIFISELFQDSTVRFSSSTNRYISSILIGSVLDPKSSYLAADLETVASKADSYVIDSLYIYGSYVKVTPSIDTLYTWLVWGDSTNTSVFSKRLNASTWNDPIGTWRKSVIGPKVAGAGVAAGNKVKPAAAPTNYKLIKYALTDADSSSSGFIKIHVIELDNPVTIPAGNIVSCIYTFVPGGAYVPGDVTYNLSGSAPQTINGFAPAVWGQVDPAITALADYADQQVDPDGWNMGVSYSSDQRHSTNAAYNSITLGDLVTAPLIGYKISGNSTVGVSELEKNGFALGQNVPNPAADKTTINFQLAKVAENVTIEVFDVRGVKMYANTLTDVKAGNYSEVVKTSDFASGVYFYTLNVDGSKLTKKMIVR